MKSILQEQYNSCMSKVLQAANKVHRNPEDITLIAVSKTKTVEDILTIYETGCRNFGENKVQELLTKYDVLPKDIKWHMIGHLQRNKVKYIIDKVCCIHSVDSYELALEIHKQALKHNLVMNVLIEINVAEEDSKFGIKIDEVYDLLTKISDLDHVKVIGFMTVAPYVDNPEENRQHFVKLRELFVDINNKNIDNISIDSLSMGMTNDYETAIEEGATFVRVGSGIFGDRIYH